MTEWQNVEAVLFASGSYLSVEELEELTGMGSEEVQSAVEELTAFYQDSPSCLNVFEEDQRYKLNVSESHNYLVRRVVTEAELPGNLMQTLAMIAYKSPVLQSDIVDARGLRAYDHIKQIMEKGFVEREPEGRTYRLRLTDKFYSYFEVENMEQLGDVFGSIRVPEPDFDVEEEDDTQEVPDDEDFTQVIQDRIQRIETSDEEKEQETEFLSSLDTRLEEVQQRVDKAAPDEEDQLLEDEDDAESADDASSEHVGS